MTNVMVQFLNCITVLTPSSTALKRFTALQRIVQHGVRQIDKEWLRLAVLDEADCFIRVQAS